MGSLSISNKSLEKYFRYLKDLDIKSKKSLIAKLTESIEAETDKTFDPKSLYGEWIDDKTSDEIIEEIREARIDKLDSEDL